MGFKPRFKYYRSHTTILVAEQVRRNRLTLTSM